MTLGTQPHQTRELSHNGEARTVAALATKNYPAVFRPMREFEVIAHTADQYQPGRRRPCGILEWPAMLRLLRYEGARSPYPAFDS